MERDMTTKTDISKVLQGALDMGASYADIRFKDINREHLCYENGILTNAVTTRSRGYGVRVYVDGSMGFAASNDFSNIDGTVKQAYDIALASRTMQSQKITLTEKDAAQGSYKTAVEKNPFQTPLSEKLNLLKACETNMHKAWDSYNFVKKPTFHTYITLDSRTDDVIFADTDGSFIDQSFCQVAADVQAKVITDDDSQTRTYVNVARGGFECIEEMNLIERSYVLATEAAQLSEAPDCPSGDFDLVITPRQLFLQIHESVGHPTELDRVLGSEAAFAGRSFLEPDNITTKPVVYGSEHVTIVADATCPKGLGTFAYDDEGVPAQNITLIDKGKFTGFQTSRDNAEVLSQKSSGAGLSDGWHNLPIVRMTNINLMPGSGTPNELIAGIEYGFLFDENKSWSIDDLRINFQFACEIAREIKDGKLTGKIFKNPIYSGITTEFWGSCDGVAGEEFWELVGVPNCGKGQPMQVMRVSHGSSPARFRKVKVGVSDVK